jgi:hypothetical protein
VEPRSYLGWNRAFKTNTVPREHNTTLFELPFPSAAARDHTVNIHTRRASKDAQSSSHHFYTKHQHYEPRLFVHPQEANTMSALISR